MRYEEFQRGLNKIGIESQKVDVSYNESDCRCWTVQMGDAVLVTFVRNRGDFREQAFDVIAQSGYVQDNIPTHEIFDVIKEIV